MTRLSDFPITAKWPAQHPDATFPWVRNLVGFYDAAEVVGFSDFANVQRTLNAFVARPAVVRGLEIPAKAAA